MNNMKKLWARFGVTLSEPGTWRGFVMILTSLGVGLDPDKQEAIIVAGLALAGLINVFFKDDSNPAPVLQDKRDQQLNAAESLEDVVKSTRQ